MANSYQEIPNPIIATVANFIHKQYSHAELNNLFMQSGAPGRPPEGNKLEKCRLWLQRCNEDSSVNALDVLGGVLELFMEEEIADWDFNAGQKQEHRDHIEKALARYGLSYCFGGIIESENSCAVLALDQIIRSQDYVSLKNEFDRALRDLESDPPTALTAACSIVEASCKIYIEENGIEFKGKQEIKRLWSCVADHIGFNPKNQEDTDLKKILTGLSSVVDGLGALRTHAGSAHGRGLTRYKLQPRHARLAVNSAFALVTFVFETWEQRK